MVFDMLYPCMSLYMYPFINLCIYIFMYTSISYIYIAVFRESPPQQPKSPLQTRSMLHGIYYLGRCGVLTGVLTSVAKQVA